MTYAEIHAAFTDDLLNRRLSIIEQGIGHLTRAGGATARREELLGLIRAGDPRARLAAQSGEELSRVNAETFRAKVGERPAFYLSATPDALNHRAVDVDRNDVREWFRHAPDSHPHGWIVTNLHADIERFAEGIRYRRHTLEDGDLELLTNGHLVYGCFLDERFYWKQSPEEVARRPRIWPHTVIEHPLSFLRLFRAVATLCGLRGPFHLRLEYRNIRGHLLPPGPPTDYGFLRIYEAVPYAHQELVLQDTVPEQFEPDAATYTLVRDVYAAFGYGLNAIPFWDGERGRFHFPGR
jgi:hypothetical protein